MKSLLLTINCFCSIISIQPKQKGFTMKKLIAIIFAISLIAPSPAQADDKIIDKMIDRYLLLQSKGCANNTDNLLLEIFGWSGGDSNYQDCPSGVYGDPLSWASPTVAFTPKDYSIWLKQCETHFFGYSCPQDKTVMNVNLRENMSRVYSMYKNGQESWESYYSDSLDSWNNIYKQLYVPKKHNCKPLKPLYFTYKTGNYVATAKKVGDTYVVKAGAEYKTGVYHYTKKEQKEHMDSCISEWKADREKYEKYKSEYLNDFNQSQYFPGKPCATAGKNIEFKDIATVKCSNNVWVKVK